MILLIAMVGLVFSSQIRVDATATGANNGSSWADAYNHLQDALGAAENGDEIWVAQGIYKPDLGIGITPGDRSATFQMKNGVAIYGSFASGQDQWQDRDPNVYETILSGDLSGNDGPNFANNSENSYHVVTGSDTYSTSVLDSFIISGGNADISGNDRGGGMYNYSGSPKIINCTFTGNYGKWAGGLANYSYSRPLLINCTFKDNTSFYQGAGIYNRESYPLILNCVITKNTAGGDGGAIRNLAASYPAIVNCTLSQNSSGNAGIYNSSTSKPVIINSIIWGNMDIGGSDESAQIDGGVPKINYSCIQGWTGVLGGIGNFGSDPCFADPSHSDYHLKSQAGRWKSSIYTKLDPTGDSFIDLTDFAAFASSWHKQGESIPADLDSSGLVDLTDLQLLLDNYLDSYLAGDWVIDNITSPCIDAGDTYCDWTAELWPHGRFINMGAFGGTKQASMSRSTAGNIADLNIDGVVNYEDLKLYSDKWLYQEALLSEDLNRNAIVSFADFAILANQWCWQGQAYEQFYNIATAELHRLVNEEYSYWNLRDVDWENLFSIYSSVLNNADDPNVFAQHAAGLLANAQDAHLWVKVGDQYPPVFKQSIERNYNYNVLTTLVPNWGDQNNRVSTGYFSDGNIGYIWIDSWRVDNPEELDAVFVALNNFTSTNGLIIDVRANGGGSETLARQVAGCFVTQSKLYAKHRYRDITQPDGFGPVNSRWLDPNPSHPTYVGKVVVLMGEVCMSSCDAFLLMMKQVADCNLMGVPSYGSSGNSKPHDLSNGVTVWLPSWIAMRPDGTCFEGEGIFPHITVEATQEQLLTEDPVLDAALDLLRGP